MPLTKANIAKALEVTTNELVALMKAAETDKRLTPHVREKWERIIKWNRWAVKELWAEIDREQCAEERVEAARAVYDADAKADDT